jgi:hypothetical protein
MPPAFLSLVLVVVILSSLWFTKMMLDHRRQEMEIKGNTDRLSQEGKSLTESELASLIREAVHEETSIVLDRIQGIEQRLHTIDGGITDPFPEELKEAERKTLGRAVRPRT